MVTKSGKETHGLDYFFSGLLNKVVKGVAIFSLSLVSVEDRRSYPLRVEQVIRSEAEKMAAKERKQKRAKKDKAAPKKKRGRPKGSRNRDKSQVELTPELKRIQEMVRNQLTLLQALISVRYLVLDGHFGNNNALQMTLQCDLHLIFKLRYDAALSFVYDSKQKRKGPRKKMARRSTIATFQTYTWSRKASKRASKPASTKPRCCIMSSPRCSMWSFSPRPTWGPAPLPMSTCSPVTWNSLMKRSSISTVCNSRSSSISGMPNRIGAWKISHRPDVPAG